MDSITFRNPARPLVCRARRPVDFQASGLFKRFTLIYPYRQPLIYLSRRIELSQNNRTIALHGNPNMTFVLALSFFESAAEGGRQLMRQGVSYLGQPLFDLFVGEGFFSVLERQPVTEASLGC